MRTWTKVVSVLVVIGLIFVLPGCCMMKKKAPEPTPVAAPPSVQEPQAIPVAEETLLEKFQKQGALLPIHFDFDKYSLKPDSVKKLDRSAEVLAQNPAVTVRIEGNCDERGTNEYNLALGERRANNTKKYLISLGIASDRISAISYGKESPLDPGRNEDAWAKNRRAHIVVLSK